MKTIRERRSSSGHASRCSGGWTTCWTPFRSSGPGAADVQQPLHPQDVVAPRLQQHRQPDPERAPVELLVERRRSTRSPRCARQRRASGPAGGRVPAGPKSAPGSTSPNETSRTVAVGFSRSSSARTLVRSAEVGLRHHQRVRGGDLPHRLRLRQPVDRVHGRDHALEPEVVLDDRLREQRVEDRRRVGEARRLHDHTPKGGDLAAFPPAEQVAQLVCQVAAQGAADTAALRAAPCARRRAGAGGGRSQPRRAR